MVKKTANYEDVVADGVYSLNNQGFIHIVLVDRVVVQRYY